jgi:hypothetical protein
MQRIIGIALGYEDLNDHDQLRSDPVMAALAGKLQARRKRYEPLAGKSTLNRLEHAPVPEQANRYRKIAHDAGAFKALFVDCFLEAHAEPPQEIVLDLDATDDPVYGNQEGRFFHGYYGSYCYLPLYIFCGRHLLVAKLRRANTDALAGSGEEIERLVGCIRRYWPQVRIVLRADSRFIVTSPPANAWPAQALYEQFYCARGEMENRIKECQLDLFADRTSTETMRVNQLRLWFASFAYVLLEALRRCCPMPPVPVCT